ncbi:MAG: hypothetical protein AMS27_01490 [Bacteroides sp. SM23_62_1]|nr:MAG: hypothetical protein AMS27_01490 [Bacteroides sp. SM23_62_1]
MMDFILTYSREFGLAFIRIIEEMSPYLLLGFLFAGILYVWFPKKKVYKYLGKPNSASVLNAALIGIPLPLCSCGVIPTGISFYKSGASKGSSVSFLVSTPQTGMDSIMVTYSLLGLPMAIIKPIIALFTGLLGGFLTNLFGKNGSMNDSSKNGSAVEENNGNKSLLGMLHYAFVEFLEDIAKWLIIGLIIAALIDVVIPDSFFTAYLGNEYFEMLLILVAAIPLYVCATGSIPIAAILMLKGLSPGAAIVFLMAGPATNAATITVIGRVLGKRTLFLYLVSIIAGALFFGILVNNLLPREWFTDPLKYFHSEHHEHGFLPYWLQVSSSILLSLLILNTIITKYRKKIASLFIKKSAESFKNNLNMQDLHIIVKGMTCNHCKATVEQNIAGLGGVNSVNADITTGEVHLSGDNFDLKEVKQKIESLGYKYSGIAK